MTDEAPLGLLSLTLTDSVPAVQSENVWQPGDDLLPLLHLVQLSVEGTVHDPEVSEAGEGPDELHLLPAVYGGV